MTFKARMVLHDCKVAKTLLEEETDFDAWRIHWAAAIALIRAVGHVLVKVDGRDSVINSVSKSFFSRWKTSKEDEIFRSFIDKERNTLLKEYESGTHPMESVPVVAQATLVSPDGDVQHASAGVHFLDGNIYRPMLSGPWEGDDCRDVYDEAIKWWELQLDGIDKEVQKQKSGE